MIWNVASKRDSGLCENELTRKAYSMLLKWLKYADSQYKDWNTRPDCGHFFGGAYWYGLETSQTALAFAVASVYGEYDENVVGIPRSEALSKAIKAIRYLGFTHDTGPVDCVREETANPHCSKTKWGGKNDKFFQASQHGVPVFAFGLAAWIIWEYLDDETKTLVQNVLSSYADRWCHEEPRNGVYFDTQTEENGWTGIGISIAATMFPEHENNKLWKEGAMKWLLNTSTTYLDRFDKSMYRNKPLANGWISNITTHPDFTAENHGFVHPNYMSAGILFKGHAIMADLIAGNEIDPIIFKLWDGVYDKVLKAWVSSEGVTVPIQGQDWWYNQIPASTEIHALTNIFRSNSDAARLERLSLDVEEKIQASNGNGCFLEADGDACRITEFQTAKDMEHQAAARIAHTYLLHLFAGKGAEPSSEDQLKENISGVYNYPYGSSIVYRTKASLASFSWRNCAMALTLPQNGLWTVTALPASYLGTVKLGGSQKNASLSNESVILNVSDEKIDIFEKGFAASARIQRGDNELLQDISFIALPDGKTVYLEKFTAAAACTVDEIRTGLIGIRNEKYCDLPETAKGYRNLYVNGNLADTFYGFYGNEPDRRVTWNNVKTLNVDNEIGYILSNSNKVEYWNKHIYPKWKGVEDIMTLNLCDQPITLEEGETLNAFTLITLPNADAEATEQTSKTFKTMGTGSNEASVLVIDNYLVYSNSKYSELDVTASMYQNSDGFLMYKGFNKYENGRYSWNGVLDKRTSGWLEAAFEIKVLNNGGLNKALMLEADISNDNRIVLHNCSGEALSAEVKVLKSGKVLTVNLKSDEYITLTD